MVREIFGDATRGGEWASARLTIDGERIVAADAPGLSRDVVGLTLLEAAAVDGEPTVLRTPIAFRIEPRALRVLLPRRPGA